MARGWRDRLSLGMAPGPKLWHDRIPVPNDTTALIAEEPAVKQQTYASTLLLLLALPALGDDKNQGKANTLTPVEISEGWILLFDGETTFGWQTDGEAKTPDGTLLLGGSQATLALPTTRFGSFELRFAYRYLDGNGTAYISFPPASAGMGQEKTSQAFKAGLARSMNAERWNVYQAHVQYAEGKAETATTRREVTSDGAVIEQSTRGFAFPVRIAFEVPAGQRFALRNVKLRPIGLTPLFNGKDLAGWKEIPGPKGPRSKFTVTEKGELNVKDGPGFLQTEGQWDDFVLQLEVIANGKHLNSGVFFRGLAGQHWSGYEAQIRNQWEGDDRTKPVDFGTGAIYRRQAARKVVSSDNEWFTLTVVAHGNHLATWVNGYQVSDFADTRPEDENARQGTKLSKGPIGLQGHDPATDLSFRNMRIAQLPRK
jgi:hypothetical protein